VTVPIAQALAALPGGAPSLAPLTPDEVGIYLRKHYLTDAEVKRRERHALRNNLYRDGGCEYMCSVIDDVFVDADVRELRKKWVRHARFSNSLKRIVNEVSTVYAEPASRCVGGDPANVAAYDEAMCDANLDGVMAYANRMLNLHRVILLGPRVRVEEDGERELVVDVVTPDNVFAVVDPNDATCVLAWGVKVEYRCARGEWASGVPAWNLWSAHESWLLDAKLQPIGEPRPHTLGCNPWLAVTYHAEAIPGFWPGEEGEDLVAAQVAIWMANILLLKETKSATTQTIFAGDTTTATQGQANDTETAMHVPEGVSATTVDMSMDTGTFTKAADHALARVGGNYGLSMDLITHAGTQSAEARELMLEPLRQIRRDQIKTFRRVERRLVELIEKVLAADAPALAFVAVDFMCDFGEPQVLMDEALRLTLFERKKALGFVSRVDYYCRYVNPDASPAQAIKMMAKNAALEEEWIRLTRPQQIMSGQLGAAQFNAVQKALAEAPDAGDAAPADRESDGPPPAAVAA